MRVVLSLALCFALTLPCVAIPGSQPHQSKTALFDFHSGFWLNLHHFLYRQAVVAGPQKGRQLSLNNSDIEELKLLSPDEKTAWDSAIAYYRDSLIQRDLLFDEGMRLIKNQLEDAEASTNLEKTQIPDNLKALLLKVAPIYRKRWWPKHDAQNRQWIRELQPLIDKYGDGIASALARIYEVPWPAPVRVDAVAYANWAGAYTTTGPTRPTICTTDSTVQGPTALEVLFHESSHGLIEKVENALKTAEEAVNAKRDKPFPFRRDLWHEVLFYTSGGLVAERIPGYVPYPDKNGLWTRAWSMTDRKLIEQDWKPHMSGTVGLEPALRKLAEDLATQP